MNDLPNGVTEMLDVGPPSLSENSRSLNINVNNAPQSGLIKKTMSNISVAPKSPPLQANIIEAANESDSTKNVDNNLTQNLDRKSTKRVSEIDRSKKRRKESSTKDLLITAASQKDEVCESKEAIARPG